MAIEGRNGRLRAWEWFLQHNPMYLLSAACMAEGARLLLVHPDTRAGDLGMILMTLGVLQAYEWAVATILIALHRSRRSPEDGPSLLLVAALFWTGPLAATAEMTAHRMEMGLITAIAAGLIALVEMAVMRRALGLRPGLAAQAAAGGCITLLVAAPPLIRIPAEANGTNELFLYAAWWLLAAIAMLGMVAIRQHRRGGRSLGTADQQPPVPAGLALMAIALTATAAHLIGMNYAYFGHARLFYGAPLVIATAIVAMEALAVLAERRLRWLVPVAVLPLLAIWFAADTFSPEVPTRLLPVWLRDPPAVVLALAAIAWWFGGLRLRRGVLFHVGSVACAASAIRFAKVLRAEPWRLPMVSGQHDSVRDLLVMLLFAGAVYMAVSAILRRSPTEGIAALIIHQAAVTLWVCDRMDADSLIVGLVAGWSWFVAVHLLMRKPRWSQVAWPVALLMLVIWGHDFDQTLHWSARMHGLAVVLVLLIGHALRPGAGWQWLAVGTATADGVFLGARALAGGPHATELTVVAGGFALLVGGAAISWFKARLLPPVKAILVMEAPAPVLPDDTP